MGKQISRRNFLKNSAIVLGAVAVSDFAGKGSASAAPRNETRVFFTEDISVNGLLKIYGSLGFSVAAQNQ